MQHTGTHTSIFLANMHLQNIVLFSPSNLSFMLHAFTVFLWLSISVWWQVCDVLV